MINKIPIVDVQILTMPGDNKKWFSKCLNSLKTEPVNVFVRPGILNDLGKARAEAFLLGNTEYVSCVDPDDYVLPGGFSECVKTIEEEKSVAACTQEYITGISGDFKDFEPTDWIHNLVVFKRDIVLEYLNVWRDWPHTIPNISDKVYFIKYLQSMNYSISFVKKPYYVWRRHHNSDSIRRRRYGL